MASIHEIVERADAQLRRAMPAPRTTSALVAASSPMFRPPEPGGAQTLTPEALRAKSEGWQRRILELAEMVPEVAGTSSLVNGSVSRVRFRVEGGTDDALRAELQRRIDKLDIPRAATLDFLSGENFIIWPEVGDPYVLSVAEINTQREPYQIKDATGTWVDLPPTHQVIRVWKPSLGNRYHASSPHKASMDLIESMYLHQLADSAVATSRLASAGILVWPTTTERMGLDENGQPYPNSQEELLGQLHKAFLASLSDRNSKDAKIPFAAFVSPEQGIDWMPQMLRIERDDYAEQYKIRFESYDLRYATAIELPVERVTGMGNTKMGAAYAIREDEWRAYLYPLVQRQVDALNERVAAKHGMTIVADPTDLIAKPDNTEVLMQLAQLEMIEERYLFEELDLDPTKAQSPPPQNYKSNAVTKPPSDFTVGGQRGGGRYRDRQ